ncbi:Fe-S cluster assembly protein HesB [Nocardioides bizhenqiangii]|uniref:Fe-S cluster assembly protein HesB n=1 Tax=Nocardioides bizhenqiangii TaxID=3095076 RepID=A0ABZ0ZLN3_9ACTN|nr:MULTISPECIES: Fe-S cluster assembly protein HesB [unclassified Nocardioides]MDZ5620232.1 Fe-S cluster assembly protein HesB [Nocardioides sp. HM23]WQQ24608.1 Fe-S cluster assembly protein HesB [Nocardioides sp. HM61]
MLTLTENACSIVKRYTDHPETPDDAGLRITSTPEAQLAVTAADEPVAGDHLVEQDGARVYLDPVAAQQLDDKVLDAGVDETGNIQFGLLAQA